MSEDVDGPLRVRDDDGQLIAAGYQWMEDRPVIELGKTFIIGGLAALAFWFALREVFNPSNVVRYTGPVGQLLILALAAIGVALSGWAYKVANKGTWRRRSLLIYKSGRLSAPYGLPTNLLIPHTSPLEYDIPAPIASIEAQRGDQFNPVNIYFSDGSRLLVDKQSSYDGAREIAVQLTRAVQELRSDAQRPPDTSKDMIN